MFCDVLTAWPDRAEELWVALAEKAYVQLNESGWIHQDGTNSYEGIEGGNSAYAINQLTGWQAYSPRVTQAFCKDGERIAGFIFVGSPGNLLEERPRPALSDHVSDWRPPEGD